MRREGKRRDRAEQPTFCEGRGEGEEEEEERERGRLWRHWPAPFPRFPTGAAPGEVRRGR